jgi:diaminopimelate epimerase
MRFEKWQALGNDYLIVEREEIDRLGLALTPGRIRKICRRRFGVDADGILVLEGPEDERYVARLRIFNPDGSEAELSGNGAREAIMYLRRRGWTERDEFVIETEAGDIRPKITGVDTCRVDMGRASLTSKDFPGGPEDGHGQLMAYGREWAFRHVSIGNPQCAIRVEDLLTLEALDLQAIGPLIEGHDLFPNRTNVSWYTEVDPQSPSRDAIYARIFERGVGETLSSGTGASGAAVAHFLRGGSPSTRVSLEGGELLVEMDELLHINLTGWARPVFAGTLSEDFIKELNETE